MKVWYVEFEENGGEYTGHMEVKCKELKQLNERTILADNVEIIIDEDITLIRRMIGSVRFTRKRTKKTENC